MYYYKFRVYYDEVEDFVRDVEILANDNFESFHHLLYECIGLKGNEFAAFSICDPKWNKQKEITLMDISEGDENEVPEYDDEDEFSTKTNLPTFVMADAVLKDFITDQKSCKRSSRPMIPRASLAVLTRRWRCLPPWPTTCPEPATWTSTWKRRMKNLRWMNCLATATIWTTSAT